MAMEKLYELHQEDRFDVVVVDTPPTRRALDFLDALGKFAPPSLLMSGGEPFVHPNFFEFLDKASDLSLRVTISTNGTMIDADVANFLKGKTSYVGVSLDGPKEAHDTFRGVDGAFDKTLSGIANLKEAGLRVRLRFTMTPPLLPYVPDVMRLAEDLGVDRICFYHFIPSGRGVSTLCPTREEIRAVLFRLFEWVKTSSKAPREVLTVGNFSDGILLGLWLSERGDAKAANVPGLLERSKGGRSGRGIISVRWDGAVFADQFSWKSKPLGHWTDIENLFKQESEINPDKPAIGGRCGRCRWLWFCRGNMRVRAGQSGEDIGCVLLDEEIFVSRELPTQTL
jgi:MoaA/NifB/PqqE/SkfB family radical SAM enzyme